MLRLGQFYWLYHIIRTPRPRLSQLSLMVKNPKTLGQVIDLSVMTSQEVLSLFTGN